MKWGEDVPAGFDLTSLRLLGSVGEPINPEAWLWYHQHVGGGRCPIMDTWWQTETGAHMITPLPGVTNLKPGSAQTPFPGISAKVVDDEGNELGDDSSGLLVLTEPNRKSTRLNSSHANISYAVFCLKKKNTQHTTRPYYL